jgi:hypothetical protein
VGFQPSHALCIAGFLIALPGAGARSGGSLIPLPRRTARSAAAAIASDTIPVSCSGCGRMLRLTVATLDTSAQDGGLDQGLRLLSVPSDTGCSANTKEIPFGAELATEQVR